MGEPSWGAYERAPGERGAALGAGPFFKQWEAHEASEARGSSFCLSSLSSGTGSGKNGEGAEKEGRATEEAESRQRVKGA